MGVAVVHLEDGGASLGLDADTLETELSLFAGVVNRLGVIVQYQQKLVEVDHLRHQLEPFRAEVVPFVDHDRIVLPGKISFRSTSRIRVSTSSSQYSPTSSQLRGSGTW